MIDRLIKCYVQHKAERKNRVRTKEEQERLKAQKRQQMIDDGMMMKEIIKHPGFQRFCEILQEDWEGLNKRILTDEVVKTDKDGNVIEVRMRTHEEKIRLIARMNQIERVLKKPESVIWQMENLTEVSDAKKHNPRAAGAR